MSKTHPQSIMHSYLYYHQLYKMYISQFRAISLFLFFGFALLIVTLALLSIMGAIGEEAIIDKTPTIIHFLIFFSLVIAFFLYNIFRLRNKLNVLKLRLEKAGLYICCKHESESDSRLRIIDRKAIRSSYTLFCWNKKINFEFYDRIFNI